MPYKDPEAQRAYQRAWCAARRAKFFAGKVCETCGSVDRLQLDHVDPALKTHHAIWSWSWPRIEAEVAKCQTLCHTCHVEKTNLQSRPARLHGSHSMYTGGCRCAPCGEAHNRYQRVYREKMSGLLA